GLPALRSSSPHTARRGRAAHASPHQTPMRTSKRAPRVSVRVPTYHGAPHPREAPQSLPPQPYEDTEDIASDNASTDATEEIATSFASRDPRVRYHRLPENIGAAANFMRVLELARGEYFRWAAADDLSAPEFIERCVSVLDRQPDVVQAYPLTKLIDERGAVIGEYQDGLHIV